MLPKIHPRKGATTKILKVCSESGTVQVPGITLDSQEIKIWSVDWLFYCIFSVDQKSFFNEMNYTVKVFRIGMTEHYPHTFIHP